MPFLSPAKILIILVVALVVLGPDKLPKVAKQAGGLWNDFRKFREKLESEVRGTFPDLPSTAVITQAVRSPLSFLDGLAETHGGGNESTSAGVTSDEPTSEPNVVANSSGESNRPVGSVVTEESSAIPGVSISDPGGVVHKVRSSGAVIPDDPSMN